MLELSCSHTYLLINFTSIYVSPSSVSLPLQRVVTLSTNPRPLLPFYVDVQADRKTHAELVKYKAINAHVLVLLITLENTETINPILAAEYLACGRRRATMGINQGAPCGPRKNGRQSHPSPVSPALPSGKSRAAQSSMSWAEACGGRLDTIPWPVPQTLGIHTATPDVG